MPKLPFMTGSYNGRSSQWNNTRCVNLFPELAVVAKSEVALVGSPGMALELTIANGTAPVYAIIPIGDDLFALNETNISKVEYSAGAWGEQTTAVHGATTNTTPTYAYDRSYILFDNSLLVNQSTLACTPDLTFGWDDANTCQCVTYMDGYFIAVPQNSDRFYVSALTDPTSWDALDYASAETSSDYLLRVIPFRKELWLFGEYTTEAWYNSGNIDFPFSRNPNAFIEVGILNKRCVATIGNTIAFIGRDRRGEGEVYIIDGYSEQKISNPVIEYHLKTYESDYDNAYCLSFKMSGHDFFVMVFPSFGSWVYDLTTAEWHEWLDWDGDNFSAVKIRDYCFYKGKHLVASRSSATTNGVGELSLDTYNMWGNTIKRLKRSVIVSDEQERIFHGKFEADIHFEDAGTVTLRYSDDGGNTWSSDKDIEIEADDFDKRLRWYRLGYSRERVYELSTESAMKTIWIDAFLEARGGKR